MRCISLAGTAEQKKDARHMKAGMAPQKPGFYTGTLVLGLALFGVLLVLCVTVYSKPEMRKTLGFFTVVLTIGSICIMTHVLMRITAAEESIYGAKDPYKVYSVGVCPDAYVLNETLGVCDLDKDSLLTLGSETDSTFAAGSAATYKATDSGVQLQQTDEEVKLDKKGIQKICDSTRMSLPYAEFRPLCG
jgi:hypothetical protein